MGGGEKKLTGPELKNGIQIQQLAEKGKLLGHVDGEAVLLIKDGNAIYAVGATCSHYSADLNEGLIAEGALRCPWHHACFDYKTGEAKKAPALNPLPTWRTEVRDDVVFVREKRQPADRLPDKRTQEHFVIVGSGAAGHAAAEMLRREAFAGKVTVLTEDSALPYDRPNLSKDYLAGNAPEEWMPLRPPGFYREHEIDVRLNSKVTALNAREKNLRLADGTELKFDKCLLTTGGTPLKPPMEGSGLPHVHVLRSMRDCSSIISGLKSVKKVAIIGAGFIGLEAAAAFKSRGLDVTVIARNGLPLSHVVGEEVAGFLKTVHEANGVVFLLNKTVSKIDASAVHLGDGASLQADLVLVATGIRPNTALAEDAGLKCEDGILVDAYLETSTKDIFAAGDAASYPDPYISARRRVEHWVVAQRQGQIAARNMLGEAHTYKEIPFFWSQQFDVMLSYIGLSQHWEQVRVFGSLENRDAAVAYYEKNKIVAVLTIGRDLQNLCVEYAMEHNNQEQIQKLLSEYQNQKKEQL